MRYVPSVARRRGGARAAVAAATALLAALATSVTAQEARAYTPPGTHSDAGTSGAASGAAAPGPTASGRWADVAHGFASLAGGTTGGAGGKVVTVTEQAALKAYAGAPEPYIIRVEGVIEVDPFGSDIDVTSNKTIVGVGVTGEIVHGELHLAPGTSNVIIRNLTIRDSYVEGDWDGKTSDFDAIQMDTVDHVWIDHNRLTHMGDGLIDLRKDSEYITVSYNRFDHHNKAFGIGWTSNVKTQVTIDHNWFSGTKQRNPSADNCAYAHLYNNYLSAQVDDGDPVWTYGNYARGRTRMVIENSYYDGIQHPYQADAGAELVQRGSILKDTTGRHDVWGAAFEPRDFYPYRLDPASAVPALVTRFSGPQRTIGTNTTLNVPADYPTVQAAVGAVPAGNDGEITIRLAPGSYREKVRIGRDRHHVTLVGTGRSRSDTLVVFDTPAGEAKPGGGTQGSWGSATVVIEGNDFTARHLTFANDFDEAAVELAGEQALAVKTTGDRLVFDDAAFLGNQDTLMVDTPQLTTRSRVYLHDSYVEGDVDFIYGRATAVIENSVIKALSRGSDSNNGYITAASTWAGNPYGILITRSKIVSDAPAGSFHLGRPWHPGGEPQAVGQVLLRDTELPDAVKASPWTDMSGFSWRDARFAEYRNTGPGALLTPDRPQMSAGEAAAHTTADYLAGADGWAPHRSR
ncbi:right-handed parallel beta-helix repeat-containing protein [Streptomyces sp. ISL-36]|uniref:pectinesterase family protein n=1 Tax=Streptomyces sp. ISL-36 TaxID=2819182 RepID=UPI001BE5929D|nr:pectinesterase family protein [Streptomyces sp. ISL-36]MBT2442475.1 right-handed parallel beta-helix repeat-containing protein [Streptomyces sp. ISL-36]